MIQEYTYKAGMKRSEIIDETVDSILKTRRPVTFAVLNILRFRWLWRLAGFSIKATHNSELYSQYEVFQHDVLLATFELKTNITTS
jgi:hypothetical protein